MRTGKIQAMFLRAICAFVLSGILVAGLWPFHAPRNEVRWLGYGSGLFFGKYGSIVSASSFKAGPLAADSSCSLEIWLEPRRVQSSGTILAFYRPESRSIPFALRQSLGDLTIERPSQDQARPEKITVYVNDVFSRQKPVLVTISSNPAGTTVYADGAFVKKLVNPRLASKDFTGQLVVGNSPVTTDEWSGQVQGLAIYGHELTADEVSQHYATWTKGERRDLAGQSAAALYLFNELRGNVVHNQVDSATDLLIPERFFVLREQFLERPWDEFHQDWNYWKDVGINIAGFIPLGFVFFAYFSLVRKTQHPAAITIALGFAVSLTIEVLQAFLPTRDSGMTDLITNTLGTAVGVMVFRSGAVQAVLAGAGLCAEKSNASATADLKVSSSQ
jgi:hypothetical protein